MKIPRSVYIKRLVDLGDGVRLESYWPPDSGTRPQPHPLLYVRVDAGKAGVRPDQLLVLRNVIDELLRDNPEAFERPEVPA